ncbi:hypothetical protein DUNSADRAFT_914 [Dunaliella salina]|uniref:Uncharacterized protein n=1 Tax=Dunaliella salina TaxID=3046 RepID=A0ABQ7H8S3_DUNSA|nr:hypothetical protein DUNSADRAFT_914 [Dunaliella salina]|eukprot:KAF5843238.1 hypothetical protein DUNSADRAFT_914 [Dunaliella salina]
MVVSSRLLQQRGVGKSTWIALVTSGVLGRGRGPQRAGGQLSSLIVSSQAAPWE